MYRKLVKALGCFSRRKCSIYNIWQVAATSGEKSSKGCLCTLAFDSGNNDFVTL